MLSLIRLVIAAFVAVACSYLAACGGGSTPFADELNEPAPATATTGSTLADLPDTRSTP